MLLQTFIMGSSTNEFMSEVNCLRLVTKILLTIVPHLIHQDFICGRPGFLILLRH